MYNACSMSLNHENGQFIERELNNPLAILHFSEIDRSQRNIVGAKADTLAQLYQDGFPVPAGYVLPTPFYDAYRNGSLPNTFEQSLMEKFDALGADHVSIRSTGVGEDEQGKSYAGIFKSVLNVDREGLLQAVHEVWDSAQSEGAAHYAQGGAEIKMGVIMQEMVDADVAGTAFTAHPVTRNSDVILIEAAPGLGENVVSGLVTPTSYTYDKAEIPTQEYVPVVKGNEILPSEQTREIALLASSLENYFGYPVDVEWAMKDGEVSLLQCRPITTLGEEHVTEIKELYDTNKNWRFYIERSFGIFGSSLVSRALNASIVEEVMGDRMKDVLMVQVDKEIVKQYRVSEKQDAFEMTVAKWMESDPDYLISLLEKGLELNNRALTILSGDETIASFSDAIDFYSELYLFTTRIPDVAGRQLELLGFTHPGIQNLVQELRSVSHHPRIRDRIIIPIGAQYLKKNGIVLPESDIRLLTISEIVQGDISSLDERKQLLETKKYIFNYSSSNEELRWVNATSPLIKKLENIEDELDFSLIKQLQGEVAYAGDVIGIARVVGSYLDDFIFEEGDILVTTNGDPELIKRVIDKCSAIICGYGGITAHASVIARERQIPCVVGVNNATSIIPDGAFIEMTMDKDTGVGKIQILE